MISRSTLGIAAGILGSLFVGYCVYFDHKRRSDPQFRQKLKQRRAKQRKERESKMGGGKIPDLRDYEAVQKFFIQEVQLGEELLGTGDVDNGIEHLTNAVAVCGQPQQLLSVLQQTLPPQIFQELVRRLPSVSQKIANIVAGSGEGNGARTVLAEDDVE